MLLLVWEINPEAIEFYVVPVTHEAAKMARKSSGHILGTDVPPWSHIDGLCEWVNSEASAAFKQALPIKKHSGITQVVHAGIIL